MTTGTWNEATEADWHQLSYTDWHQWTEDPSTVVVIDPTTVEFAAMAVEMIDEFITNTNAVWVSSAENTVSDSNKPWEVGSSVETRTNVKILFLRDKLEDRQLLRYLKEAPLSSGQVNGLMYPYSFTPRLKDSVEFQGKTYSVHAIDPIQPIDQPILYTLELGS